MKFYKSLFLFVLLLFPVLIYLFLQGFGENRFEVPIYYQSVDSLKVRDCSIERSIPLVVNNELLSSDEIENPLTGKFLIFELSNGSKLMRNNMSSFLQKYDEVDEVLLVTLGITDTLTKTPASTKRNLKVTLDQDDRLNFVRCELQIATEKGKVSGNHLVLVDPRGQIRGYFDPLEMNEIDRLSTELLIIIQNQKEDLL